MNIDPEQMIAELVVAEQLAALVRKRELEDVGGDVHGAKADERKAALMTCVRGMYDILMHTDDPGGRQTHNVVMDLAYLIASIATALYTQSGPKLPNGSPSSPRLFVAAIALIAEQAANHAGRMPEIKGIHEMHNLERTDRAN